MHSMTEGTCCLCRNPSSNNCNLGIDRGTSMATPIAAGAAILVRQYFTDGWYPGGAANASAAYQPSAALLKAVLLGISHTYNVFCMLP